MKRPIVKDINGKIIKEGVYLLDESPVDEEDETKGTYSFRWPVLWHNKEWCIDNSYNQDGSHIVSMFEYFGNHLKIVNHKNKDEAKE